MLYNAVDVMNPKMVASVTIRVNGDEQEEMHGLHLVGGLEDSIANIYLAFVNPKHDDVIQFIPHSQVVNMSLYPPDD